MGFPPASLPSSSWCPNTSGLMRVRAGTADLGIPQRVVGVESRNEVLGNGRNLIFSGGTANESKEGARFHPME